MSEEDLALNLYRRLKGKTYLILLDDVWDSKAWDCLKLSFPDDSRGSRILLTSRHRDAAPQDMLIVKEPHFLHQLTEKDSFILLQKMLSPRICWSSTFYELGKQIAEKCKGLPLTIVVVAGLLANLEIEGWKDVLESLSSGFISSTEQCMNVVEMSYIHLPEYLKSCFLYFGLFPEDQEVSVRRLIWLWIAEGFVPKTQSKSLEDVASDYMMDLVARSLVIVSKKRSIGGVKACRIHDLLHDFCRTKAREEKFFHLLKGGYDELLSFREPSELRRLCIYSRKKHFKNLRLFSPCVRSLLFFIHNEPWSIRGHDISFIVPIYKHLWVLDIEQFNLGSGFPIEMGFLVVLKYLAVKGDIGDIPSSMGNLSELETLVVESTRTVSLPDAIWKLLKLRHLHIPKGFHIPNEDPGDSPVLDELESCSGAIIYSWDTMGKQLSKFPNIRKLKCTVFHHWDPENCNKIVLPDFLTRLGSFDVTPSFYPAWHGVPSYFQYEFGFPENIKKLTLNCFKLPQSKISTIGELPELEVLKLLDGSFDEGSWDMVEGKFSKLRFLQLSYWNIVSWTASEDYEFPSLEKLVLEGCRRLNGIPSCLEDTPTLKMVEIRECSEEVVSAVKDIEKAQKEISNTDLKILISHHSSESSL